MSSFATLDALISHKASLAYWTSVTPDVNGMLGGFPQISRIDLLASTTFVAKLRRRQNTYPAVSPRPQLLSRAVDCGAGIGRITLGLLTKIAEKVDIVEPIEKFSREISEGVAFADVREEGRIGEIYNAGLESWTPSHAYDIIWNQWCLGHLTDKQLVEYLIRCKGALRENGWIVVKENLSKDGQGEDIFDEVDSSVTRSDWKWKACFEGAGLRVLVSELQRGFPKGLFKVRTYALQPANGCGERDVSL